MVISYDERKNKYNSFTDDEKKQRETIATWENANETTKNYWNQYQNEQKQNQQQTQTQPAQQQTANSFSNSQPTYQNQQQNTQSYNQQQQQQQNQQQFQAPTYDPEEKLDTNMFWESDGKISLKEWTAKYTGKADYTLNSDARMQEITNNLNAYWQNNPEYFSDRDTYNKMFNYNERSNEQKALLDSYWKKKDGMDTAQKYTNGDSILNGMKDADITNDQLNYIKEYNPEAYRERQQKQQDAINLRIANLATPADPTDNAELFSSLAKKLNLEPWESRDIYGKWEEMCDKLWVFQDSERLKSYQTRLDQNHQKMESIMSRYSNSAWWTVSDTLAAARMQKALAPYQQIESDLQNSYTVLLNGRNSNLALANQSAQVMQMQAQEDQRIFNQRLQGLWFAMQTANYRSPEQQAQLQLQTQQIQQDMNLLNQSMQQDLNLYNQYASAKLQNQLSYEMTDLDTKDPAQQKANLNNVLSQYYEQYGDIIQRSQAQTLNDILNYAKEKNISVAQALTENFIKPLQNKAEYKQQVANSYGMLSKQSIATINWKQVVLTTNPNGCISYNYISDPSENQWYTKPYDLVDSTHLSLDTWTWTYTLWDFLNESEAKDNYKAGQCGKFVNDYLQKIGLGRYYDDDINTKLNSVNSDIPIVWSVAVFDYNHKSGDWVNYGHVGIVTKVYEDGSFDVKDSNYYSDWVVHTRHILAWSSSCKGFFDPSQPPRANSNIGGKETTFNYNGTTYDFTKYPWWRDLTDDEWLTVEGLLTYQTNPASLPKSWADNGKSNARIRAAAAAIGRDAWYTEGKFDQANKVIKDWQKAAWPWGSSSANSTAMSILKAVSDSFDELWNYDINTINKWINDFKSETWDPTVWALYSDLRVASSEIAKALKGGASPTTEEINDIKELLSGNMGTDKAKAVFQHFARNLYEKNESEALNFYRATWYKPDPIYTDAAAQWLNQSMGIDLSTYYNYQSPIQTWPSDDRTKYFDGLFDTQNLYSEQNIDFILW